MIGFALLGTLVGVAGKLRFELAGDWITAIGIATLGAVVGGSVGMQLGFYGWGQPVGFLMPMGGAAAALVAYRAWAGRRAPK